MISIQIQLDSNTSHKILSFKSQKVSQKLNLSNGSGMKLAGPVSRNTQTNALFQVGLSSCAF